MNTFRHVSENSISVDKPQRIGLDERFLSEILPETPLDRVESQELRQQLLKALQQLTGEELRVVELRFQYKKSTGQVASKLQMDRDTVATLEQSAIEKIRQPLIGYLDA